MKDYKRRGSGSRVVDANWNPDDRQLNVNANDPGNVNGNLGLRLSRSLPCEIPLMADRLRRISQGKSTAKFADWQLFFHVIASFFFVRIPDKTRSQIFDPTAQHLASFLEIFFGFDVLCLVYESIFQRESEKNFQDFDFGIGFQKVCFLEIFWLGIPENG